MNAPPDKEEIHQRLTWLNRNRQMLLDTYKNQYVAYNSKGIIAHSENLQSVLELAKAIDEDFVIYLVPRSNASIQILAIRFGTVARHSWLPNYQVKLKHNQIEVATMMLVDSGAELSLISLNFGQNLGYALADAESTLLAETVGGNVEYVLRNIEITIDGHTFLTTIAWLQTNTGGEQLLLGREGVFDRFNIEFRQADEQIIFIWREDSHL